MPQPQYHDNQGQGIDLSPRIGSGGEGAVFGLPGRADTVAKLYHQPPSERQGAKLTWMVQHAESRLCQFAAWPTATLHHQPGGPVVGFLMPRFNGYRPIHSLYSPAHRRTLYPRADWAFLTHAARNCAAAFDALHAQGIVVGDVNQSNVLVNDQALVCMIDCDSFQVSADGDLFLCEVGVGPFTPPELQGQSFRGVVRTANHDRFGLAVLLFHLLFMGRHPFAGRFLGKGEMPLEKAIQEGRFAYSRIAEALQMQPPPNTLPLTAVPADLVGYFEQALLLGGEEAKARPAAAQWELALSIFLKGLRTCSADPGHKVPPQQESCPWCGIIAAGGPNFFLGVAGVAVVFIVELTPLNKLWARIEAVQRQKFVLERPVTKAFASPTATTNKAAWLRRALRAVDSALGLFVVLGVLTLCFDWRGSLLCGVLALIFFGLRHVLIGPAFGEAAQRRKLLTALVAELNALVAEWFRHTERYAADFDRLKSRLKQFHEQAGKLQADYDADRRKMDQNKEEYFLDQFLKGVFLSEAEISGIGPGRKMLLASYGIETAFDLDKERLAMVRGIGPVLTKKLLAWRRQAAKEFRFDPQATVPESEARALVLKYRQLEEGIRSQLQRGATELEARDSTTREQLAALQERIKVLTVQAAQTEADLKSFT